MGGVELVAFHGFLVGRVFLCVPVGGARSLLYGVQ